MSTKEPKISTKIIQEGNPTIEIMTYGNSTMKITSYFETDPVKSEKALQGFYDVMKSIISNH